MTYKEQSVFRRLYRGAIRKERSSEGKEEMSLAAHRMVVIADVYSALTGKSFSDSLRELMRRPE